MVEPAHDPRLPGPLPESYRCGADEATRGSVVKLAADALGRAATLVASLVIARGLGPEAFGVFALVSGIAILVAEAADLGVQATASRALVAQTLPLRALVRAKIALAALVVTAAAVAAWTPSYLLPSAGAAEVRALLMPLVLYYVLAGWSEFLGVALRARGFRNREAATILCFRGCALLLVLWSWSSGGGVTRLAWALAFSAAPAIVLGLLALLSKPPFLSLPLGGGERSSSRALALLRSARDCGSSFSLQLRTLVCPRDPRHTIPSVLRTSLPLAVNGLLALLSLRIEILVLAAFAGDVAVGLYAAALKVVESLILVPAAITAGAMPALTLEALKGTGPVRQRSARTIALLAVPAALGATLLAPGIVGLLFGAAYAEAALPLRLLAPVLVAVFMNTLLLHTLLALGDTAALPRLTAARLLAAVALASLLVPRWGAAGAALSFSSSEALLLVLAARACARRGFAVPVASSLAVAAGVSLPMAAVLPSLDATPLAGIAVGFLVYAATLLAATWLRPALIIGGGSVPAAQRA
jgi:O-antigen/teichoic acid export membrane protein